MKHPILKIAAAFVAAVLICMLCSCDLSGLLPSGTAGDSTKAPDQTQTPGGCTDDDDQWDDEDPSAPYKDPFDEKTAKPLDGAVCTTGAYVIHKDVGVRPAIRVSL